MRVNDLGSRIGLVLCLLFLVAVWRLCWFPSISMCREADLGVFASGMLVSSNLFGSALMAIVIQGRLHLFQGDPEYLAPWYVISLIGITTLLGLVQWFLVGKLVGKFMPK